MARHERMVPVRSALISRNPNVESGRARRLVRITEGRPSDLLASQVGRVQLHASLGELADRIVDLIDAGVERDTELVIRTDDHGLEVSPASTD